MNELKAERYLRELGLDGELEEVEAGDVSQTYRVGDQYYLQFSDSAPVNLRRGILGLESQQDKGIPVPEIVYSDPEEPLLVTEALPGENIGRTNSEEVYRHVGEVMAEIHEQKFDQYGYMNVENGELVPSGGEDWTNTLSQIHHNYMSKGAKLLDESKAAEIDSFFYEGIKSVEEDPDKCLAHFDFHENNILYKNGEVTGVLDWDMLRVVDPALDVIKAENQFRREGNPAQAFRQGYESQRNIGINQETKQVYRLLSEVGKLSALQNLKEATNTQMDENELNQTLNNIDQLLNTG